MKHLSTRKCHHPKRYNGALVVSALAAKKNPKATVGFGQALLSTIQTTTGGTSASRVNRSAGASKSITSFQGSVTSNYTLECDVSQNLAIMSIEVKKT